jgi:hypothetical protein
LGQPFGVQYFNLCHLYLDSSPFHPRRARSV